MMTESLTPLNSSSHHTWIWKGHPIQYTVEGSGLPLILIHGFGASIGHWRKNIPILADGGYQVFALDLLGFGNSAKPPLDYHLGLWQELLKDFCEEHIKRPTIFIGNSIGALLALMMVTDYPEIARGGVLINCAGGISHRPDELRFPLRFIMGLFSRLVASPLVGTFLFNQIRQKHRIRNTLRQVYGNPEAITDELVEMLYQPSCHEGAQQVFASVINAPPGRHPGELLPQVQRPLLVLWGTEDPWTPISGGQIFAELAEQGQPVQFIPIPETGHCPHDERPEVVNPLILEWLTQFNADER